ncbi:MAG: isoamylase early set domain-containing protein, partial [Rhodothermales bacterium]|nr:isoamylase early set domain-containing protein [Rhodothermales bacterium]
MIRKQKNKGTNKVNVTFVLPEEVVDGKFSVGGDFNDWDPSANRFVRRSNATYSATVKLGPGETHEFRYYADGDRWLDEDDADAFKANVFGTQNCVVET